MEKLQAAMEKARARRDRTGAETPGGPRLNRNARKAADNAALWEALEPIEAPERLLQKNRIMTLTGNASATPYDMLRTKILKQMTAKGWTRLAITSPDAACGKTTTACNLAGSLSRQIDIRTILMEMDMRRPSIARMLGHRGPDSVFDVLEERVDFAEQAVRLGRNVALAMNAGPAPDPAELFLRDRTGQIIDEIEAEYRPDIMIFDMPPMLVNDDTSAFLAHVDCALILAAAEVTTVAQIDACEREMAEQTNILGVVLNKYRYKDDNYGQYQYY